MGLGAGMDPSDETLSGALQDAPPDEVLHFIGEPWIEAEISYKEYSAKVALQTRDYVEKPAEMPWTAVTLLNFSGAKCSRGMRPASLLRPISLSLPVTVF